MEKYFHVTKFSFYLETDKRFLMKTVTNLHKGLSFTKVLHQNLLDRKCFLKISNFKESMTNGSQFPSF